MSAVVTLVLLGGCMCAAMACCDTHVIYYPSYTDSRPKYEAMVRSALLHSSCMCGPAWLVVHPSCCLTRASVRPTLCVGLPSLTCGYLRVFCETKRSVYVLQLHGMCAAVHFRFHDWHFVDPCYILVHRGWQGGDLALLCALYCRHCRVSDNRCFLLHLSDEHQCACLPIEVRMCALHTERHRSDMLVIDVWLERQAEAVAP